jgi:mannose-6-phosphate isomerase-like protein (cupin superfamily)
MTTFIGMIRLHFIWICLAFNGDLFTSASNSSSNGENDTLAFPFPNVKPDPFPVLVQGPAGELFNFTKIGYSTLDSFSIAYATVPPGGGPAPHIHHWTDEWFYFPEGGIVLFRSSLQYPDPSQIPNGIQLPKANMHRYHSKSGDLIYGPRFYVHGFRNEDNVTHPMIFIWSPDKISEYFFVVGQILTDPCKRPPVTDIMKSLFVSEAPKYGINQSSDWDEYVASWSDDWQPPLGMGANGQELLDLLGNSSTEYIPCQTLLSHAALLQSSFIFIYSIGFIIARMLSILF